MSVYNSKIGSYRDDSDITIINPSIIPGNNDEYGENTQVANSQTDTQDTRSNASEGHDIVFVDHDPLPTAKQLEQILLFYIRDLKQESNSQLDCDKQLTTRLMDLIRPAYVNDQQKMIQLDKIIEEIGVLHDKRHIDQKEKIEHLRAEVHRLNRMLLSASNDQMIYNDTTRNYSMASTMTRGYTSTDVEQWTEIEDDAKKLHELVQSQRQQINEIVSLISQTAAASTSIQPDPNSTDNPVVPSPDKQPPQTPTTPDGGATAINNILERIKIITGMSSKPPAVPTTPATTTKTLVNPSPGSSPTESLNTLTSLIVTPTIVDPKKEPEPEPEPEPPHPPIDIPVPEPVDLPTEVKKCPVCNRTFPPTCDDIEVYDHIEKCLFPTVAPVEIKDYECPNCNSKFPGNNDAAYLQHLSDCYNQGF